MSNFTLKNVKKKIIPIFILLCIMLLNGCTNFSKYHKIPLKKSEAEILNKNEVKTLKTFKKIDSSNLFTMNYYNDYSFKDYLKRGSKNDNELYNFLKEKELYPSKNIINYYGNKFHCACISTKNNKDQVLLGRNFDWYNHPAMLLYTKPKDGYASVSMVDLYYLGYDISSLNDKYKTKKNLLSAPYFPLDGMNECGVAVGEVSIPYSESTDYENKKTIGSCEAIRLILDYASNVDEAIKLVKEYNVFFNLNVPVHMMVVDKSGDSVIIEFVNKKVSIIRNKNKWQVLRNFILTGMNKKEINSPRHTLYLSAEKHLSANNGNLSKNQMMELLSKVIQPNNQWSVVYDLTNQKYDICIYQNYNIVNSFKFGEIK